MRHESRPDGVSPESKRYAERFFLHQPPIDMKCRKKGTTCKPEGFFIKCEPQLISCDPVCNGMQGPCSREALYIDDQPQDIESADG